MFHLCSDYDLIRSRFQKHIAFNAASTATVLAVRLCDCDTSFSVSYSPLRSLKSRSLAAVLLVSGFAFSFLRTFFWLVRSGELCSSTFFTAATNLEQACWLPKKFQSQHLRGEGQPFAIRYDRRPMIEGGIPVILIEQQASGPCYGSQPRLILHGQLSRSFIRYWTTSTVNKEDVSSLGRVCYKGTVCTKVEH